MTKCQVNICDQPSDITHSSEQQREKPSTTGQIYQKLAEKQGRRKCDNEETYEKNIVRRGLQLNRPMLIYVVFALKQKKKMKNGYVVISATYGITDVVWTLMMRNGQQYLQ